VVEHLAGVVTTPAAKRFRRCQVLLLGYALIEAAGCDRNLISTETAARAAFSGAATPNGWSVLIPKQLGVAPQYWDGIYFSNNGASAIVLQQGNAIAISFRGTDSQEDFAHYPELLLGTYINHFQPLLTAIATRASIDTHFYFTGDSLGGGAVNEMADIASSQYAGRFAAAQFVAFASPAISNANRILNVGFENDPIYKLISKPRYAAQPQKPGLATHWLCG
jgi:hypothetical protein